MRIHPCQHVPAQPHLAASRVCDECIATGDTWVHLRTCLHCGHVGCCDDSKNRHATGHYRHTGHAVIQSAEPGEDWRWCYVDDRQVG
jgi:uncharacterized UBP type Zn finger protein